MESERLQFREIELSDSDFIVNVRSNPEVYKYFINPHKVTLEEHLNWFQNIYSNNIQRTDYIAYEKSSSKKVGVFGLIIDGITAEINYLIIEEFQHKGFAKEGINYLLSYANKEYGCKTAIAEIHEDNFASVSLARKLGFSKVSDKTKIQKFEKKI